MLYIMSEAYYSRTHLIVVRNLAVANLKLKSRRIWGYVQGDPRAARENGTVQIFEHMAAHKTGTIQTSQFNHKFG
jgi:hypothetical protein